MKLRGVLITAVVCFALGAAALFGYQQFQRNQVASTSDGTSTTMDLDTLKEAMQKNNELSCAKYLYTADVAVNDVNDLSVIGHPEMKLPFTDANYTFEFDGTIKAGFDLDDASVTQDGTTVTVTLPAPKVLSHETGDISVVHESQNILNPLKAGQESSWIDKQKSKMEDRALDNGLLDDAKQNAKATFESLFSFVIPDGVTLDIKFQERE